MYKILSVLKVHHSCKKSSFCGLFFFFQSKHWLQSFKKKLKLFFKSCCKVYHSVVPFEKKSVLLSTTCNFFLITYLFSLDQFYRSAFNNPVIQCAYKIHYQHLLTWSVCKMHGEIQRWVSKLLFFKSNNNNI